MMFYIKFFALVLLSVVVSVSAQDASSSVAPALAKVLGREYLLDESDHTKEVLQAWNYTNCEIKQLTDNHHIMKLTEDNGEFLLTSEVKLFDLRFDLNKEVSEGIGEDPKYNVSINGTTLTMENSDQTIQITFGADELQLKSSLRILLIFKSRQTEHDSTSSQQNHTSSNAAPTLAPFLGKEYVFDPSTGNLQQITDCLVEFYTNYTAVVKLTEDNGKFELTNTLEFYEAKFQLGKETEDSSKQLSTFTLNGTTLTRVAHTKDDPEPYTSVWKFEPEVLQFQEDVESSDASLIFKVRT